jgi:hypothetical protein
MHLNVYVCTFAANNPEQPALIEDLKHTLRADRRRKLGELQAAFAMIDPSSPMRMMLDTIMLDDSDLAVSCYPNNSSASLNSPCVSD